MLVVQVVKLVVVAKSACCETSVRVVASLADVSRHVSFMAERSVKGLDIT